jgi:nucleoside-diphosphate-sugar epimerase
MTANGPRDLDALDDLLSTPPPAVKETMRRIGGDLIILGVGGKMGPTLAAMARCAADGAGGRRRVIGVARFSSPGLEERLQARGVETVRCDLLDREQVQRLPDAANVIAMLGMKFGSAGQQSLTWAVNALIPALICEKYRASRIVAFSTGNVYGLTPVRLGGSREEDELRPVGEYSMTALGRERMYEHGSRTLGIPMALLRLNYATEMRYGVLVDIAQKVLAGEEIDVSMGQFNAVWQPYANAVALLALEHVATPPLVLNVAGPETLSVRRIAEEFGRLLGREPLLRGQEAEDAYLSNAQRCHALFGYPDLAAGQMVAWIADWLRRGQPTHDKPTRFEVRDGRF